MKQVGQYAYLHGKLHGITAKSFLDTRFQTLLRLSNLSDVYRTLFPGATLEVSEKDLVRRIERKYELKNLDSYLRILSVFPDPPPLLVQTIRRFEIRNVKSILRSIHTGLPLSELWDIGRFGKISIPLVEPEKSLEGTPYASLLELLQRKPLWEVELHLDEDYYRMVWEEIHALDRKEESILRPAFITELRWLNILWALRLRYYYRIEEEETIQRLFLRDKVVVEKDIKALYQFPLDEGSSWQNWKYGWMVAITPEGQIDPAPANWRVSKRLYLQYRKIFYHCPFTLAAIYGFFRMKEYEVRLIHTLTEGIQIGVPETTIRDLVEGL